MKTAYPWLVVGVLILTGCAASAPTGRQADFIHLPEVDAVGGTMVAEGPPPEEAQAPGGLMPPGQKPARGAGEKKPAADDKLPRKIIYTADLKIIVEDFAKAEEELKHLVRDHHGIVAQSEVTGSAGSPRGGRWKLRVPVDEFDDFVQAAARLGVPQKNSTDSQDITEEYYDLEARLKSKKVEEERLLRHLEQSTGKLEEILAVEKELSRVRGEIEQHEGRLRMLANLVSLTTVTVTIQEVKNYVPPQAPTFAGSVADTFFTSLDWLGKFGQGLVLVAAALAPWLAVVLVVALPAWLVWLVVRWRLRRAAAREPLAVLPAEGAAPAAPG
jgi:hypothetical protein